MIAQILTATIAIALLVWQMPKLRGTTLVGPCVWAVVAMAVLAVAGTYLSIASGQSSAGPMRLIYATGTFCPLMAVLGARRPHHGAWNFIVASLCVVAALPALEAIFLGRGEALDIGGVRGWFLWLMIALGLFNYLPTRHALSAILVAAGQIVLFSGLLPGVEMVNANAALPIATLLFLLAIAWAIWTARIRRRADNEFDARWREFRDAFGALWGVRILERVNAAARTSDWPFSLTWTGFYFHDVDTTWGDVPPDTQVELRQTINNLLRRFMAPPQGQMTKDK